VAGTCPKQNFTIPQAVRTTIAGKCPSLKRKDSGSYCFERTTFTSTTREIKINAAVEARYRGERLDA
jgi:hypothetical protein